MTFSILTCEKAIVYNGSKEEDSDVDPAEPSGHPKTLKYKFF